MVSLDLAALVVRLKTCVCAALVGPDEDNPLWTGQCCIWPSSQVAWDNCCESGGQAWVALQSGVPTSRFPAADTSPIICSSRNLAFTIEVGVIRCVNAEPDTDCDVKEDDVANVIADFQAILSGVVCCLGDDADECAYNWTISNIAFRGPDGGCAGSTITLIVEQPFPCCPIEES